MKKRAYKYPIVIYEEKGGAVPLWIGNFPGLNGCWVEGPSLDEVLSRAPSVLREYAEGCEATGWPMPDAPDCGELTKADVGVVRMIEAAG